MSEWREFTLGGIGEIFDGPHATPERRDDGPYFLNIASLTNGRLDLTASDHVDEDDFSRWTRRVTPRANDLLFSYETRLGEAALMPEGVRACLGRRMGLFRLTHPQVHPRFMLYLWLSPSFKRLIDAHTIHGATVNRIPLSRMDTWRISLPSYEQQRAIAEVLGALDDKIEANRKLAATVDDLLAMRMGVLLQHSNHRAVLAEVAALNPVKRTPVAGGHLRYLDIASVSVGEYEWPPLTDWETAPGRARRGVQQGDIVWSSVRPKRRSHALILDDDEDLVVSTGLTVIRARPDRWATLYEILRRSEFSTHLEAVATGSAYPAVKPDGFRSAQVPWLLEEDAMRFEAVAAPLRLRRAAAVRESRALAALRDSLLPKLMSGRLRVEEAELVVAEAV